MRPDSVQTGHESHPHMTIEHGPSTDTTANVPSERHVAPVGATQWTPVPKPTTDPVSLASWSVGIALVSAPDFGGERAYLCDPEQHRIDVVDHQWRPLFSFGGHGAGLGQFDTPTDISVVWLSDVREEVGDSVAPEMLALAVADLGNHRIQLFDLDGAPIAEIRGESARSLPISGADRTCAPFFRIGGLPRISMPSRLEWRAPYLEISCARGAIIRVDLAAALLPDFRTWIREASVDEVRDALEFFDRRGVNVPAACVDAMQRRVIGGMASSMEHAA